MFLISCLSSIQSVTRSCPTLYHPMDCKHARPPCPSPTPGVLNSCPLSWWCHPTISSSVIPFSSCLQSFPASGSFPVSQLFTSGGQNIGISASASVLPMNLQDWFPLGWTGWISLQSKGLSRVFSNTTVQKHWFFNDKPSLWSSSQALWSKSQLWLLKTKIRPIFKDSCNVLSSFLLTVSFDRTNWPSCLQKVFNLPCLCYLNFTPSKHKTCVWELYFYFELRNPSPTYFVYLYWHLPSNIKNNINYSIPIDLRENLSLLTLWPCPVYTHKKEVLHQFI